MPPKFFIFICSAIIIFAGCAPQKREPVRVCPGKNSAAEALSILMSRLEVAAPLKAVGQCHLRYCIEDNNKSGEENFPVKLWVNPPAEIYLQGDVAFDAKAITLGSNKDEFWLSMKPKEISSYWWGNWSEKTSLGKLTISPKLLLEALGLAAIDNEENWSLSKEGAFDVLTKQQGQAEIKKIYIYNCDYLIRKIEYLNEGRSAAIMELDGYKEVPKGFFVPGVIKIINRTDDGGRESESITFNLNSIKAASFTDIQRKVLFTRPQPRGFKHIYKIVGDSIVEQSQ